MKLVIDIPDSDYAIIKKLSKNITYYATSVMIYEAIRKATPLPKGHGRLIDIDKLMNAIGLEDNEENREENLAELITLEDIDRLDVIIEADKEN